LGVTYGTYDPAKLLKYDDVIVLCVDVACAWLEIRNYKDALYDSGSPDEIDNTIVIGAKPPQAQSPRRLRIGLMLDPLAVIAFQRALLPFANKAPVGDAVDVMKQVLCTGLAAAGVADAHLTTLKAAKDFPAAAPQRIEEVLRAAGRWRIEQQRHADYVALGFVGYFPKPSLIAEDERTWLYRSGKTQNQDSRDVTPVPSSAPVPPKSAIDLFIDSIDQDIARENKSGKKDAVTRPTALHAGLPRVSCFAFRGDDRDPVKIHAANGFLPGMTRTDSGMYEKVMKVNALGGPNVKEVADALDKTLKSNQGVTRTKAKRGKGSKDAGDDEISYLEMLRKYAFLHLGEYAIDQTFRGYISTTKSIAIAKHFANAWKKDSPVCQTWCYAVRCHGGYELPSHMVAQPDADGKVKFPLGALATIHEFASYFEQEISVAGAVWWDHVAGFRLLDCTTSGQFFAGPIYLREPRFWEVKSEQKAFGALFEVLSGRSQGAGIYKSYKPKGGRWDLLPNVVDGVDPPPANL
jgi:hypothetical protein